MELLRKLYEIHYGRLGLLRMAYRSYEGGRYRQATQCLRRGLSAVASTGERDGRFGNLRLVPEGFVMNSGRVGDRTRLSQMGRVDW